MLKNHKKTIILTSIIILLPILIGLILWEKLPDQVPTHYNFEGVVDGWSSKGFAVFGLPFICLGAHLICTFATAMDPKVKNTAVKVLTLIYWICPCVSILCSLGMYSEAMGMNVDVTLLIQIFVGIVFIIVGNYLPKCRQNHVLGIKLPWTLADEENWNRTHRLAGWIWIPCGMIFIVNAFLNIGGIWVFFILLFVMVIVPTVYSAAIFKRRK